jgi:poly [ADP-ribose] polymerase
LGGNSNKFWTIRAWDENGRWIQKTEWGRVGNKGQSKVKDFQSRNAVYSLIRSKARKGYEEVQLATVSANGGGGAVSTGDDMTDWFVYTTLEEANEYIGSYLSVTVDQLSVSQVRAGREDLVQIRDLLSRYSYEGPFRNHGMYDAYDDEMVRLAECYYKAIPTQLPHRIKTEDVVLSLIKDMREQEERLDQLETAVHHQVAASPSGELSTPLEVIGAHIQRLDDSELRRVTAMLEGSYSDRHWQAGVRGDVKEVFGIRIPSERDTYSQCFIGNPTELWHGTSARNVRHILRTGLIIPSHAANGSMLGRGIYFADRSSKSVQYCRGNKMRVVFLAEVKIGESYIAPKADSYTQPPAGYDSILGKANKTNTWSSNSYLAYNEYVVYKANQQSIRYAVLLE